ncbi:hypothetical protein BGW41_006846 [Actinomortierella wolfii]|nr:hypothetical protein BGW41_006846 [Actinomortierella wolfii]
MHLSSEEENALKAYLTPELDRLCDADPNMLADYVIALVKNDKLSGNTEDRIQHELADFMGTNIDAFASSFARVLNSKSYMPKSGSSKASESHTSDSPNKRPSMDRTDTGDSTADHYSSSKHRRGDSDGSDDEDRNYKHARRSHDDHGAKRHRGDGGTGGRHNYSPSNPTADDRSSSYESSRRRRPSNDAMSGEATHFQNAGGRGYDRRSGDRTQGGGGGGGGMGSREAPIMTSGYRQREGLDQHNDHGGYGRDQWNNTQMRDNNFNNDWQGRSRDDSGYRGRGGPGGGGNFGQERKRPRCRDYDQKGFCMRGDQCPYDHGDDRIVVDELPRMPFELIGGRPGGGPLLHGNIPGMPGMDGAPAPQFYGQGGGVMPQVHDPTMLGGALPHLDGMANRGGNGGGGPGRFPGAVGNKDKNQLVVENIPQEFNTIDQVNNYFKKFGPLTNIQVDQVARKALIQYATHEEAHAAYSSPEVIFNNRFVKVYWLPDDQQGTIVNTTLPHGGGGGGGRGRGGHGAPSGGGSSSAGNAPTSLTTGKHPGGSSASAPPVLTPASAVFMTPEKAAELEAQRAALLAKQKQMEEIQKQKELLAQRQQEIQKQMYEKVLNNKNISQEDKDAILKGLKTVAVEVKKDPIVPTYHPGVGHHAPPTGATSLSAAPLAASVDPQKRLELLKEAERLEKERLDRELDALNKGGADGAGATGSETSASQAEGKPSEAGTGASEGAETTAALKAKLAALQAQAAALGLDTHTGGYAPRGRGGYVPRGRGRGMMTWTRGGFTPSGGVGGAGAPYRAYNLDMRSTKVSVQQLEGASEETLREHFQKFGELESVQISADGQSATVQFKVRKDAEIALQQGARLSENHTLKLGWATATGSTSGAATVTTGAASSSLTSTASSSTTAFTTTTTTTATATMSMAATTAGMASASTPVVTSAPSVTATTDDAQVELDLAYHEDSDDEERSWKR